ncbi:MAG: hypothetical protein K5872_06640 [Rhizobiaceae bacterium]|nr:hypothetical protein [Rhizobiaceae bacterium]MCV0405890.1 hypothetical protein [Rhizobiaceae bacterium]
MRERQFHKVSPAVWRSRRFNSLPDDPRVLWFYFATGPHQTSAGCSRIPPAYASADLGWSAERYAAGKSELVAADLIVADDEANEIYVCRWFQHCPPTNAKHAAGIASNIYALDSDIIRERVEADFAETLWGGRFLDSPGRAINGDGEAYE